MSDTKLIEAVVTQTSGTIPRIERLDEVGL